MKRIFLVAVLSACGLSLAAQSPTMFNFSAFEYNPAASGMAGAARAQSQLAFGVNSNPAMMTQAVKPSEIVLGYQNYSPKVDRSMPVSAAYGQKIKNFAFSVAATYIVEKPYDIVTDPSGAVSGTYTPKDLQAGLAVAYQIIDCLSLGVSGRVLYSDLAEGTRFTGFASNAFVAFHKGMFAATAGVSNVGPKVSKLYSLPSSATVAAAVNATELGPCAIAADVDFDYYFNGGIGVNAGAQFCAADIFYLRAGYHYGSAKAPVPSYASAGIGLGYSTFRIDASYLFASNILANTLSVGLTFVF